MKKNAIIVLAVTILLLTGQAFAKKLQPEEILKKTAAAYKALHSYSDLITVEVHVKANGSEQNMEVISDFALRRPNLVSVQGKTGMAAVTFVSNGEKMWFYIPMFKKYSVSSAPASYAELLKSPLLGGQAGGPSGFIKLFKEDPLKELMEDVVKAGSAAEEKADGFAVYHLALKQKTNDVEMWIDAKTFLIRKIAMDMTKMIAAQRAKTPDMPEMEATFVETHTNISPDAKIPDDAFKFTAPEGTAEVRDLMEVIRARSGGGR
jgi:outer membrane lipoprotein-sorting protein